MTMRTLLTAAAIISSAGFGIVQTPASRSSYDRDIAPPSLANARTQLGAEFASFDQQATPLPPEAWAKGDPADSLYRAAREAMSRGDYKRAAEIFHRIPERYPQSAYASQAMYYEAYSLYRAGGDDDLQSARSTLGKLKVKDSKAWKADATTLLTRVCGELAKRGDESCTAEINEKAEED